MKKLGFGTMRLPLLDANDPKSIDIEQFKNLSDVIVANRMSLDLKDCRDKVYTRDLFERD